ncbi:hypothetical protein [Altericista sp. CCNU0014]
MKQLSYASTPKPSLYCVVKMQSKRSLQGHLGLLLGQSPVQT